MTTTAPETELLLDRLLSASTPSDCLDSLERLRNACRADEAADAVAGNESALSALCRLLSASSLPSDGEGGAEVEGGETAAAELISRLLPPIAECGDETTAEGSKRRRLRKARRESVSKSLLRFHRRPDAPSPSAGLIPSLLDCLSRPSAPAYPRVLCLEILSSLLEASAGETREQLVRAPDGIARLVDLLGPEAAGGGGEAPEEARNASVLFLADLASSSSALARLVAFSRGFERSLRIALEASATGGMGGAVPRDCLRLCLSLASADDVARELFSGGGDSGNLDALGRLMDLRRGERFLSAERNLRWWRESRRREGRGGDVGGAEKGEAREEKKKKRGKRRDDDLDEILRGAGSEGADAPSDPPEEAAIPTGPPVPYLTPDEAALLDSIFDLLLVLLYDGGSPSTRSASEQSLSRRRARAKAVASHDLLSRSIADCALYTLPPPGVDYVSAVPTGGLQRKGLTVLAVLGSAGDTLGVGTDGEGGSKSGEKAEREEEEATALRTRLLFETMPLYLRGRVTAMERLMFLACTGAYRPDAEEGGEAAASLLALNSVAAFRSCLPAETACRMVLHALAPPPPDAEEAPSETPAVARLVATLAENSRFLRRERRDGAAVCAAAIGAAGAAQALGVFLAGGEGDAAREMMLRVPPPPPAESEASAPEPVESASLIDFVLQFVASFDPSGDDAFREPLEYVALSMLRLLAEWIEGMPKAVSEVLSSPSSVSLGVLARSKGHGAVPAMSGLLLGLCLDCIAESSAEPSSASLGDMENSAWTKETIVNMIQSMGVGRYFSMLDEWKKKPFPLPYCSGDEGPVLERRAASTWYAQRVTQVRRRIVATLAGDSGENDLDSDDEGQEGSGASTRSLRKMIKSQAKEMEELQRKLDEALETVAAQSSQIKSLQRVAELGTSAEANDLLAEYSEKISELEKEKARIASEAEKQSNLHKEAMLAKDAEVDAIKEELGKAQVAIEEAERDKEILGEEMNGLSAAYNLLEQEYRSNNSAHTVSETREMTAGGEGSSSVPGGEAAAENPGRTNHQLQMLQDENARLREDVRAANEWMAMAVSKMDEMGRENESLSSSLEEARNQTTVFPSYLKEKDDELAQQQATLKELQQRNEEAQEWMASAVTRVDALTKEVDELKTRNAELEAGTNETATSNDLLKTELEEAKAQNATLTAECETLQSNLTEFQSWSETAQARLAVMEAALQEVTAERDELKKLPQSSSENSTQVESLQAELNKKSDEANDIRIQLEQVQSQLIEESDANEAVVENLRNELDQQKHLADSLASEKEDLMAQIATKENDTSQNRVSELEATLREVSAERDELKQTLQSTSWDTNVQVESLQSELQKKTKELNDARLQLEQVQSQLIEESDANEAAVENIRSELEVEKQRAEALAREKEDLTAELSAKQSEIDSINSDNANLRTQIEVSSQCIAALETAKKAAESHAQDLMNLSCAPDSSKLEDEIIALTADRNEIKSHFDDLSEEYEETKQMLERVQMENGNLVARNRALEQDNKSLEYQFAEASSKSSKVAQLQSRITELEELANSSQADSTSLQEALDEMKSSSEEAVNLWKERADELEATISTLESWKERAEELEETVNTLESQMEQQEQEALEAIAQWEARCAALEGSGDEVVQQWQERTQTLEAEITELENQVASLSESKLQLESLLASSIQPWQERTQTLEATIAEFENLVASLSESKQQLESSLASSTQKMQQELEEKDEAIASYDEQIDLLMKELIAAGEESEQVVKQWQDRSEQLEASINELTETLGSERSEAADAISLWEARCTELNNKIEELEVQSLSKDPLVDRLEESLSAANQNLAEKEKELSRTVSENESLRKLESQKEGQISSLLTQLEDTRSKLDRTTAEHELIVQNLAHKETEHADQIKNILAEKGDELHALNASFNDLSVQLEEAQESLTEANEQLALKNEEWHKKEASLNARIAEFQSSQATSSKSSVTLQAEIQHLQQRCIALEQEKALLANKKEEAQREIDESKVIVYELQEELRCAKEEMQSFATDQFSARASEIATHALRQQMLEVRSQYEADRKALATEKEARMAAEAAVEKLKADLALLSQASEYDANVDVHIRKIAKKMTSENTRKERQEMEELRSTLELLKEELGTCRWKMREAEESAAHVRLQKSILEQEVCAAKSDLVLMEQRVEDLETSKIDVDVAVNYRIDALTNERMSLEKSFHEEFAAVKAQLARANQEKDKLAHQLEQSERANANLALNTITGEESESEVQRLQLERAQLLAKITEIGVDSERRVREAVAAHASYAEAELIIEKQSRKTVECTLADTLSELEDVKSQLLTEPSPEDKSDNIIVTELRKSLAEMQIENRGLEASIQELKGKIIAAEQESQTLIDDLRDKLHTAEARVRAEDREHRFETALASEIARLRHEVPFNTEHQSHEMTLEPGKEFANQQIINMYEYVEEQKTSIEQERQMYQSLLEEHEALLELVAQLNQDNLSFGLE